MCGRMTRYIFAIWNNVNVEVTFVSYIAVTFISSFMETNLLLRKSCSFNLTSEPDLTSRCDEEKYGQQFVAKANSIRFLVEGMISIFSTFFMSTWAGNHGHESRPMIYIPVCGLIIVCLFDALNSYYWTWNPWFVITFSALVQGFSGGKMCHYLGAQLYAASTTTIQNRTFRIGMLTALLYVSMPIGTGIAGILNTSLGFCISFLVCSAICAFGILVGYYKIKDPSMEYDKTSGFYHSISPVGIFRSVSIVWKKRRQHKRLLLILLLLVEPLHMIQMTGEQTVMYLYLRYRFGWQENEYSLYTAYKMLGTLSGTLFCTIYLSKYLKIHDGIIGTIAGFWDTVGNISYFYADQTWQLYVIPLYNIFNGVLFAMMASLSTKCVEHNEMGYLTSVRSLMQIVTPLSFPLYGLVYKATIDFLPHAFFLLSMAFNFPTIILFAIAYYLSKDMKFDDSNPVESNNEQPPLKEIKQSS